MATNDKTVDGGDNGNADGVGRLTDSVGGEGGQYDVDPSQYGLGAGTGAPTDTGDATPKRRGRKPGSGKTGDGKAGTIKQTRGKVSITGAALSSKIQGFHAILAAATGQPIFALSVDEAAAMSDSVAELMNFYGWSQTAGPAMLWFNLAVVMGAIYYPRYLLLKQQVEDKKQ